MGHRGNNHSGSRSNCKKSKKQCRKKKNPKLEHFKEECHKSQKYPFQTLYGFKLKTFFIDAETLENNQKSRKKFEHDKFDIEKDYESGKKVRNKSKNNHISKIIKRTKAEILRDNPNLGTKRINNEIVPVSEKEIDIILHKQTIKTLINFGMSIQDAREFYSGKLPRGYKLHHPIPLEFGGKPEHVMVLPNNIESKMHKFIDAQETDLIKSGKLKLTIPIPNHAIPRFNPNAIDTKIFSNDIIVNGWNPHKMPCNDNSKFKRQKLLQIWNNSRTA